MTVILLRQKREIMSTNETDTFGHRSESFTGSVLLPVVRSKYIVSVKREILNKEGQSIRRYIETIEITFYRKKININERQK